MKNSFYRRVAMLLLVGLLLFGTYIYADSVDLQSGRSYIVELETLFDSIHWAGIKVVNSGSSFDEGDSNTPFTSLPITMPIITTFQFPGDNLNDGLHYYAATQVNNFTITNLYNTTASDLFPNVMFDSSSFPDFYPDYYNYSDNPDTTFCCSTQIVQIGGENFSGLTIVIEEEINYTILKYNDSGTMRPFFLVPFEDATCYNGTSCVGQFMLPISPNNYYFYLLSQYPAYDIDVFIDGVETTIFSQTALPYIVTIRATNAYTQIPEGDVNVYIAEEEGHNLFVPFRLAGYISEGFTAGFTNSSGEVTFLVAPTAYPPYDDYVIKTGVLREGILSGGETLTITNKDGTVTQSKPVSPQALYDNAKASVNAMNQIVSFMFQWSSQLRFARQFTITYDLGSNSFSYLNRANSQSSIEFKTGIPNVIKVEVRNGGFLQAGYTFRVNENDGYLIVNPYTESTPLDAKNRTHRMTAPTSTDIIVTPTSLGFISSNITIDIIDSDSTVIDTVEIPLDASLSTDLTGAAFYDNDVLKGMVNNMNIVVSSLFTALNT